MDVTDRFARELASTFPWFEDPLEPYLDDGFSGYAYVFLAVEVTPVILSAYISDALSGREAEFDWRGVLRLLDDWLGRGDPDVANVIKASVLLQLPQPGVRGYGIVDELPERLGATFGLVRPSG
jgi:hypothetical protein